ncbi:hypothetical protein [Persephonella sp.]|uniref:hypothetical protein n=1 Tax=Persephonella sp. TaxID=2060922 RepID=UPI0025F3C042|nr:hypothetical protein [Persephonella sp.]
MGWVRYIFVFLFLLGTVSAQPFVMGSKERIIILNQNMFFGKFFYFKKNPVKMVSLPGDYILKINSKTCPLGFILAERKYIQGYYDINLEPIEKKGKCVIYVGNIPERKLIKDLIIGQLVLTYCELDSYVNCDRGEITWELYYFPSEKSK